MGDSQPVRRIKDDMHRTSQPSGSRLTGRSSALLQISEGLRRPRVSLGFVLVAVLVAGLALWGLVRLRRPGPHKTSAEAQTWYDKGLEALRSGAYFQASKALSKAIEIDGGAALAHTRRAEALMEMGYANDAKDEMLRVSTLVPERSVLPQADALTIEAINLMVTIDFPRAVIAESALTQLMPKEAYAFVDLGRAYEKNEEPGKAIENYIQATNLDPQNALAYLRVGVLYGRQGNFNGALAAFHKAEEIYAPSGNIEGRTSVLIERSHINITAGHREEAHAELQLALELSAASGNDYQQVSTLLEMSRLSYTEGAMAKAQDYANHAIDFAQQHGLNEPVALGLKNLGYTFFLSGNYEEAEKTYQRGLEFARRNKLGLREAEILQNLGSLYDRQLRTDEALNYARQALEFFEQGKHRSGIYTCQILIGRANRRKGDYEAALKTFQQTLEMARDSGYQPLIAFSLGEIATVLTEQERYPEASARYDESYTIHQSLDDRRNMAYSLMNRGNVLWRLGLYTEARAALGKAEEMAKQPDSNLKYILVEVPLRYAEIALSERRYPEAKAKSQLALELAGDKYESVAVQARYTLGLAQAFSRQAREGKATCEQAVEMAKRTGDAALQSRALLALAEASLEDSDAQTATASATAARDSFNRAVQLESEWRAWLVLARAASLKGDRRAADDALLQARNLVSRLRQNWGAENFAPYLARPDIQFSHKQLGEEVPVAGK
jgi:tetratricopeptide (TPR) repeat protein